MSKMAKYFGHCQACGNEQKLPGGVLSKHGYKVVWNSFWNICPGAGHDPFEKSKDLVESLIKSVARQIEGLKESIEEVPNEDFVMITAYGPRVRYASRTTYEAKVAISDLELGEYGNGVVYNDPDHPDHIIKFAPGWSPNQKEWDDKKAECVHKLKENRIAGFKSNIREAEDYIKWQEGRIENWTPAELRPIEEETGPEKKWYSDRFQAWAAEKALKEAGYKVRVRRDPNYGRGATLYNYGKLEESK